MAEAGNVKEATELGPAQLALAEVQHRPRRAITQARQLLADTPVDLYGDDHSTAERAIGLACLELNDMPRAVHHLRRAVRVAQRHGSATVAGLARMSLAYVLANVGRNGTALREATLALSTLQGPDAGRARMQRGVVLHFTGRFQEAVRDYGAAIDIAQTEGDLLLEARARNNRGLLRAYVGAADSGDLERAAAIFRQLGLELAAVDAHWNSGIASAQRGDVGRALQVFAEVELEFQRLRVPRPGLMLDRVDLLLSVPLVEEARAVAAAAVQELSRRRMTSDLAEALLAQARAALLAGDLDVATTTAEQSKALFRGQRRRPWLALAWHVQLRADFSRGTRSPAMLRTMIRQAKLLEDIGWRTPALTGRIEAAKVAIDLGRSAQACTLLTTASRARRHGLAGHRAQGWYATAVLHRLRGNDRRAAVALRRGLAILDEYRASLGAVELRAQSGAHGQALAREGLDIALTSGRPGDVLTWAESWRASALRMTPVVPPRDARMVNALAELRTVSGALETAMLEDQPVSVLRREQTRIEEQVRDLARQVAGERGVEPPPTVGQLLATLDGGALVELVAHGGRLLAVVVAGSRATLHELGALDDVLTPFTLHRFALRRLISQGDSDSARAALAYAREEIDRRLLQPLRNRLGTRPLVIVPTAAMHAMPWSSLPTCAGRAVTVAPSAAVWLRAAQRSRPDGTTVLVAGPRLPAAVDEVIALASAMPGAVVLTGPRATAAAVTAAIDGARMAHIAAHGVFRADNALLSTIALADGPLTAYEVERLRKAPDCVVLSACDAGLSAVHPGDELMGFSAILLGAGTRTLIASVLPVPAEQTTTLMIELHRQLHAGRGPAEALSAAQLSFGATGDAVDHATAAAFVCFGAG